MSRKAFVYVMIGLPASGKSTTRRHLIDTGDGQVKGVNRDSIRDMLDNGTYSPANEDYVVHVERKLVREMLQRGYDVVVDDTNLDPDVRSWWKGIAESTDSIYVEIDFRDVPVQTCIDRDALREGKACVGEDVIWRMYNDMTGRWAE